MPLMMCDIERVVAPIKIDLNFIHGKWPKYNKASQQLLNRIEAYMSDCSKFCDMVNVYEEDRAKSEPAIQAIMEESHVLRSKVMNTEGDLAKENEEQLVELTKRFADISASLRRQHMILNQAASEITDCWKTIQRDYSILVECIRENHQDDET